MARAATGQKEDVADRSAARFEAEKTLLAEPAAVAEARALLEQTLADAEIRLAPRHEALLVITELEP